MFVAPLEGEGPEAAEGALSVQPATQFPLASQLWFTGQRLSQEIFIEVVEPQDPALQA